MCDVRGTRLRADATTTARFGSPSAVTLPTIAGADAAGGTAAAAAISPQSGHGGVAIEGGGKGGERVPSSSSITSRSDMDGRRILYVLVVEWEKFGGGRRALPWHAPNVTDQVRPISTELRVEIGACVDPFGDASEAIEVELSLEGGYFVVWYICVHVCVHECV